LGLDRPQIGRLTLYLVLLTTLVNIREIKAAIDKALAPKKREKFIFYTLINIFLTLIFLIGYAIFQYGSPLIYENHPQDFKAAKEVPLVESAVISQEFKADSNNLGTVGIKLSVQEKILGFDEEEEIVEIRPEEETKEEVVDGKSQKEAITDQDELAEDEELIEEIAYYEPAEIVFRIKEKGSNDWFYENTYYFDEPAPAHLYPFGFPMIKDSKDKTYIIELFGVQKFKEGVSSLYVFVPINKNNQPRVYYRYVYPKSEIKNNIGPVSNSTLVKINQALKNTINQVNLITIFLLLEILTYSFLNKNGKKFKKKIVPLFSQIFLFFLFLIVTGSLVFDFIKTVPLKNIIDFLSDYNLPLALLFITFSFLTSFFNRKSGDKQKKKETVKERKKLDFSGKFFCFGKVPVLENVTKKTFWEKRYHLVLIIIILIGLILRLLGGNIIQAVDFYNLISAKALIHNGFTSYTRNLDYSYLIAFLFKTFSPSLFLARILPIIYSLVAIFLIYLLGKEVLSKKIGIIGAALLSVSPWFLSLSLQIREYSFNIMIATIIYLLVFKSYKKSKGVFSLGFLALLTFISFFLLTYSYLFENFTIIIILYTVMVIFCCFLVLESVQKKANWKKRLMMLIFNIGLVLVSININKIYRPFFLEGFTFQADWFGIFFEPRVQYPMQWFSSSLLPFLLIVFIFLQSLFFKNTLFRVMIAGFLLTLLFFSIKFDYVNRVIVPRYVSHVLPLYIIIFSAGLYNFFKLLKTISFKKNKVLVSIIFFIIFIAIINPYNIFFTLYIDPQKYDKNEKRASYTPYDNRYYQLFDSVKKAGAKKNDPIVLEGINNLAIWFLDYDIDSQKKLTRGDGNTYDNGINMYIESRSVQVFQMEEAIQKHDYGWILTKTRGIPYYSVRFNYKINQFQYMKTNIPDNKTIREIVPFENGGLEYRLYRWEKT